MIYLDNCATTYPKPEEVYSALDQANRQQAFNIGRGGYQAALRTTDGVEETRQAIAGIAETAPSNVVFSSSATQALNQIIFGLGLKKGDCVYVSPFEHNSIVRPLHSIEGLTIKVIPFNPKTWSLETEQLRMMLLADSPKAVFVSEVSNVTGYKLPWNEIFEMSKNAQAVTVLDASQSFRPGNQYKEYCDFIVFNGHKSLVGPMGVAGFIRKNDTTLVPFLYGGTGSDSLSEKMPEKGTLRFEAGTQNSPAIIALKSAITWLKSNDENLKRTLGEDLAERLRDISDVSVYLPLGVESNGIISFNLEGYTSSELASILDTDYGIAVRGGYHCSPLVHDFIGSRRYDGTVRVSIGYFNTPSDIDAIVSAVKELSEE